MSVSGAGLSAGAKAGVAVVVLLVAGAGAGFVLGVGPFGSSQSAAVSQVPSGADVVVHVDGAVRDDPATKALVNQTLAAQADNRYYSGPTSYDQLLSQAKENASLDPGKISDVVSFGKYPAKDAAPTDPSYMGVVVHASWSTEDVAASLRNNTDRTWTEGTYNGHTVYKYTLESEYQDPEWYGVLGDGEYAFGSPNAVKDAVDVAEGDHDALHGDVKTAYQNLRDDALVAYVVDVPRDRIPNRTVDRAADNAPVDYSVFTSVDMVSGVYYSSSDSLGVSVHLHSTATADAKDVRDVTDGGISFASGTVSNETVKQGLRDIEVARDGKTVTVSYEKSVGRIRQLVAALRKAGL